MKTSGSQRTHKQETLVMVSLGVMPMEDTPQDKRGHTSITVHHCLSLVAGDSLAYVYVLLV